MANVPQFKITVIVQNWVKHLFRRYFLGQFEQCLMFESLTATVRKSNIDARYCLTVLVHNQGAEMIFLFCSNTFFY